MKMKAPITLTLLVPPPEQAAAWLMGLAPERRQPAAQRRQQQQHYRLPLAAVPALAAALPALAAALPALQTGRHGAFKPAAKRGLLGCRAAGVTRPGLARRRGHGRRATNPAGRPSRASPALHVATPRQAVPPAMAPQLSGHLCNTDSEQEVATVLYCLG